MSTAASGPPLAVSSSTRVDNLNADYLDGIHAAAFRQKLDNVATVAKSGGDFSSIQSAIDSITDATASNRWVVLIAPGQYVEKVTTKSYVYLVGAGPGVTVVRSSGGDLFALAATLTLANNSRVRNLSVDSSASNGTAYAIGIYGSDARARLERVEVEADGGVTANYGLYNDGQFSGLNLIDSEIRVLGTSGPEAYGAFNHEGNLFVDRSEIMAEGATQNIGIANASSTSGVYLLFVERSTVRGATSDIEDDPEFSTRVRYSQLLDGGYQQNGAYVKCAFVLDSGGVGYASSCP